MAKGAAAIRRPKAPKKPSRVSRVSRTVIGEKPTREERKRK